MITLRVFIACLLILIGIDKEPETEIYLIPEKYRGKVNIIFNQVNGSDIKFENNSRIYKIPENGILLTKVEPRYGELRQEFYYVNRRGVKKRIEKLDVRNFKNESSKEIKKVGIFYAGRVGVYGNSNDSNSLRYQEFFVSNYEDLGKYVSPQYEKVYYNKLRELTGYDF